MGSRILDLRTAGRRASKLLLAAMLLVPRAAAALPGGGSPFPELGVGQAVDPEPAGPRAADPLFDDAYDEQLASAPLGFPDPFEPVNRATLRFNRVIDHLFLDPATELYDLLVPEPVEPAIRRVFRHLASGSILLNELLQLHPKSAATTAVRFVVNSTAGLGGLFDFARCGGLYRDRADFGQTLAYYGLGSGPYLVLPLFGPSNFRDASGDLVDGLLHPALYLLGPASRLTYGGSVGIATREEHYKSLEALEKSAVDYYAALRNAYYQVRQAEIADGADGRPEAPVDDEYDAPCTRTLSGDGAPSRLRSGSGPARFPVSRWSRSEMR